MKRHDALVVLSREHHDGLILAQLLKKGAPAYKGLPSDLEEKANYAAIFYNNDLEKHFDEEEQVLIRLIRGLDKVMDQVSDEIIGEHALLRKLFSNIHQAGDLSTQLDNIGVELEKHIRKEERVFFPLIQALCSRKLLEEIGEALSAPGHIAKKDIENRDDIKLLVDNFYEKVKTDKVIGFIFNDVAKVNWEHHLPVMYDFWENTLFYTGSYVGNPMEVHKRLNQIVPLTAAFFQQWLQLFISTVDNLFTGEKAELAKQRGRSITTLIQLNISKLDNSIGRLN